jgi:hypothetical protein
MITREGGASVTVIEREREQKIISDRDGDGESESRLRRRLKGNPVVLCHTNILILP